MNLTTVGAALNFAKELEAFEIKVCKKMIETPSTDDQKKLCRRLSMDSEKRIKFLTGIYEDFTFSDMDVGILSPIGSINGSSFISKEEILLEIKQKNNMITFKEILEKNDLFYGVLSERLQSDNRILLKRVERIIKSRSESRQLIDSHISNLD